MVSVDVVDIVLNLEQKPDQNKFNMDKSALLGKIILFGFKIDESLLQNHLFFMQKDLI